jgi:hypothetical protein
VTRWDEVVHLFKRVERTLEQIQQRKDNGDHLRPVSDAKLRMDAQEMFDITMPDEMAMAPTTLVLGVFSL